METMLSLLTLLSLICVIIAGKVTRQSLSVNGHRDKVEIKTNRLRSPLRILRSFTSEFLSTISAARDHLKAGAAARGISILLLYPLDTVKTRMQLSPVVRNAMPPLQPHMLFRGVWGSLAGQIPYGMLTFGSYEVYKGKLLAAFPGKNPFPLYVAAAIMGDLTGSFWLCPSEVLKQQVQGGLHSSFQSAISSIYKTSGVRGFYRGFTGQILRDVPFRAVQLPSYEFVKGLWTAKFATDRETKITRSLRPVENMAVGIIAGTFSAAITTPLDVVKTRLMTGKGLVTLGGAVTTAKSIVASEGFKGLFSGLGPRVAYVGPSVGLFFVVYEGVKTHLNENK